MSSGRPAPGGTEAASAEGEDRYDRMLRLADLFDVTGDELTERTRLAEEILHDPSVAESAELSPVTFERAEAELLGTVSGPGGLAERCVELEVDALMVRATVRTYRWIDELQEAAYQTLGAVAGRAVGYLAPEVALGGAVVAAGLIEADALDRDGVTAYLDELAEHNPELMDHLATGGGGLLDGLQMRALLTAGVLADDTGRMAASGGLRAAGVAPFPVDAGSALRDVAAGFVEAGPASPSASVGDAAAPRGLAGLMGALTDTHGRLRVDRVGPRRYVAYLGGPGGGPGRHLRLVGGDHTASARRVVRALEEAVAGDPDARVMLVGSGQGGLVAAEVAATATTFTVDQVVTAGAPSAQVPRLPGGTRMLSLEDRRDPVALLGSLVNAGDTHRTTVVFDGGDLEAATGPAAAYLAGGRAVDRSDHPRLALELRRLRDAGYLAP